MRAWVTVLLSHFLPEEEDGEASRVFVIVQWMAIGRNGLGGISVRRSLVPVNWGIGSATGRARIHDRCSVVERAEEGLGRDRHATTTTSVLSQVSGGLLLSSNIHDNRIDSSICSSCYP